MSINDFEAVKKWNKIPKEFQVKHLTDFYCAACKETDVEDYYLKELKSGILIKGKCKICKNDVEKVVEDEELEALHDSYHP